MALLIPVISGFNEFGRVFSTVSFKWSGDDPNVVLVEIPADCNGKIDLSIDLFSLEFRNRLRDASLLQDQVEA